MQLSLNHRKRIEKEIESYENKFSKLNSQKDALLKKRNSLIISLTDIAQKERDKLKKIEKREEMTLFMKLD